MTRGRQQIGSSIVGALLVLAALPACSLIQKPQVSADRRITGTYIPHTGDMLNRCTECHSSRRPTGIIQEFEHAATVAQQDCSACHAEAGTKVGVSWSGAYFRHSASQVTCSECHAPQVPTSTGPFVDATGAKVPSFDHSIQGNTECLSCHQAALNNMLATPKRVTWSQTGSSFPANLTAITAPDPGATDVLIDSAVPVWGGPAGTTITSFSPTTLRIPQTMNHYSLEVSPATLNDCTHCHADSAMGDFRPGYFHSSSLTQFPRTCTECHGSGTLFGTGTQTTGMPSGFVGTNGPDRIPASPEMNHYAKNWNLTSGGWSRTATPAFNQDCAVCHTQPGGDWAQANFHTSLATSRLPQPTSCLDCHANSRPSGWVPANLVAARPTRFDHADGLGDCASCHTAPTSTFPPLTSQWSTGNYHANAGPQSSCTQCHESQRPTSNSGWTAGNPNAPFDFALHGDGMDCVACHGATNNFSNMTGWGGGFYQHSTTKTTSCVSCHTIPDPSWYPSATGAGVAGGFAHATGSDCAGCHGGALSNVIGQAGSPNRSAWINTGQNGLPSGLVGNQKLTFPTWRLTSTVNPIKSFSQVTSSSSSNTSYTLSMLHSSSQIPVSFGAAGSLTCSKCHNAASVAAGYRGGLFHASLTAVGAAQPTQCTECHKSALPTGIVGLTNRHMDHDSLQSNGKSAVNSAPDCATCHAPATAGQSGAWGTGGFFHGRINGVSPAVCSGCHYLEVQPRLNSVVGHMNHSSALINQDCAACHAQPSPAQIGVGGYPQVTLWSGGKYHSGLASQPTSCNDCHASERPAVITLSPVDSGLSPKQYMNHGSSWAGGDCVACHSGEVKGLSPGSSPTAFLTTISFHTAIPSGVTSCKDCHGLANGSTVAGNGNTIPAGATVTATTSAVGNSGATITPFYQPPAAGAPIRDLMSHTDGNVTSRDCNACHTTPAANAGPAFAKWQVARFHNHVPTVNVTAGKCANCHYNIMPNAAFGAFNHTTLISATGAITTPMGKLTSDCGSCHSSNIGTNWQGASAASPHTGSFLQTSSCVTCHVKGGPQTYSGNLTAGTAIGMPTSATNMTDPNGPQGTYTMTFYHVPPATVPGKSGGTVTIKPYDLSATSCVYCHGTAANGVAVATNSTNVIAKSPAPGQTGWSGGVMGLFQSTNRYSHKLNPTTFTYTPGSGITAATGGTTVPSCSGCHEAARPNGHHNGKDCAGCHSPSSKWN